MAYVLEHQQRLSRSLLWELQSRYYDAQGVDAWDTIPFYVTSNSLIASAYAQMAFGWLRDLIHSGTLDRAEPVYIVELGAGAGRFSFHFMQHFFGLLEASPLREVRVQYIMTDFPQRTLDAWAHQPQLQAWVARGLLDFAHFDAYQTDALVLVNSQRMLSPDTIKNPMTFIANYFFDVLLQDAFYINDKTLYERRLTLQLAEAPADPNDPMLIKDLEYVYENHAVSADYYDDPDFNRVLRSYQSSLIDAHLLIPIGALQCVRRLRRLANGRMLLLSADKAHYNPGALNFSPQTPVVFHGGSFSMAVNFNALGRYTRVHGGTFLYPQRHFIKPICTCAFLFDPDPYPETKLAYQWAVEQNNPVDFFHFSWGAAEQSVALSFEQIIACLRLSHWDGDLLVVYYKALMLKLDEAVPLTLRVDLANGIHQLWHNHYHMRERDDVPRLCALLLDKLGRSEDALPFYQHSLDTYGPKIDTLYPLAQCYERLGRFEAAIRALDDLLAFDPDYRLAQSLRAELEAKMNHVR